MKRWFTPAMFVLLLGFGLVAVGAGANELLPWAVVVSILPVSAWCLEDGRKAAGSWFLAVGLIAVIVAASAPVALIATGAAASGNMSDSGQFGVKKFSSYEELVNFVKTNAVDYSYWESLTSSFSAPSIQSALAAPSTSASVTGSETAGSRAVQSEEAPTTSISLEVENVLDTMTPTVSSVSVAGSTWTDNSLTISDNKPTIRLLIQDNDVPQVFLDDDANLANGFIDNLIHNGEWNNGAATSGYNFENTYDNNAKGLEAGTYYVIVEVTDNLGENDNWVQAFIIDLTRPSAPASVAANITAGASATAATMITTTSSTGSGDFGFTTEGTTTDISADFSTTNIQVDGVDEADIVKTDGEYIYVVSGNRVIIIDAYPAEDASALSEIEENTDPVEIFINGDKLVVLGQTFAKVYDISDRENPVEKREVSFDGSYFKSRMIGDFVYLIINSSTIHYGDNEIILPQICSNGGNREIQATEIYYFENLHSNSYKLVTIMAINTQNDDDGITSETFLMSTAQNIFVSSNNIYVTYTNGSHVSIGSSRSGVQETDATIIHKIAIADGEIEYKSQGAVPGRVLNQFSMDEYQGYFRIATTTGEVDDGTANNHVYVLDEDLDIVGGLVDIAPSERIYSARFMGSRVYLVTFKKVDPLFVIDLSDPRDLNILGELEIPGYSDYLHPYDENHLIGLGKETTESSWGDFAWYQGVKIALFDVSDPGNPQEISKHVIGERGTDSYALRDHRAFMFSKSKNLLVIPVSLVDDSSSWWRRPSWQGAYVFDVSLDDGFVLRGGITHYDNDDEISSSYSYYSYYNRSVKRSLYIDNVLYTVSEGLVKMNDLGDLSEINEVELNGGDSG